MLEEQALCRWEERGLQLLLQALAAGHCPEVPSGRAGLVEEFHLDIWKKILPCDRGSCGVEQRGVGRSPSMKMFTNNWDKSLSIPLGSAICLFGQEGGSELPRGSPQAKLSRAAASLALLPMRGEAASVPHLCLGPGRALGKAGHGGALLSSPVWKGSVGAFAGSAGRAAGSRWQTHPEGDVGAHDAARDGGEATNHHRVELGASHVRQVRPHQQRRLRLPGTHPAGSSWARPAGHGGDSSCGPGSAARAGELHGT